MFARLESAFAASFLYMLGATALLCIVHTLQRRRHRHFGSYPFVAFAGFPILWVLLGAIDTAIDSPTETSRHMMTLAVDLLYRAMLAAVPFSLVANLILFTQPREPREKDEKIEPSGRRVR